MSVEKETDKKIIELYTSGVSIKEIADTLGVSYSYVYTSLKRNKVPRHKNYMLEYLCPKCGKLFYIGSPRDWVYRKLKGYKVTYYCSYTCYRKDCGE